MLVLQAIAAALGVVGVYLGFMGLCSWLADGEE